MEKRLLLAMDIDGTTVGKSCRLGEKTKAAFLTMQLRGHVLCFDSGRHDFDMTNMQGDDLLVDYLLLDSGGKLKRTGDGQVLMHRMAKQEDTRKLIELCLGTGCVLYVVAGNYMGVNRITDGVREYAEWAGIIPTVYYSPDEVPTDHTEALMASGDLRPVMDAIDRQGLAFEYSYCEPGAVDIMPKGVNKWTGLQELSRIEGIAPENVIAVGNYLNDLCMVSNAGLGVAVGNAVAEIKNAAGLTLKEDCEHDAMAELISLLLREDIA